MAQLRHPQQRLSPPVKCRRTVSQWLTQKIEDWHNRANHPQFAAKSLR
jgi:hypothetical protein